MTWTRWDVKAPRHRIVGRLAKALGVRMAEAMGLWFNTAQAFAENHRNGRADEIEDAQIEAWAMWQGKPGKFAPAFRKWCVGDGSDSDNPAGVIVGWWRQDALLRKQLRDSLRLPSHLREQEFPRGNEEGIPAGFPSDEREEKVRVTEDGNEKPNLTPSQPSLPARLAKRLAGLAGHAAEPVIAEFLEHSPPKERTSWVACLLACLDGLGLQAGRAATIEELAAACGDYLKTPAGQWGLPHFRSFVERQVAKRYRSAPYSSSPGRRGGKTARQVAAAKKFAEDNS